MSGDTQLVIRKYAEKNEYYEQGCLDESLGATTHLHSSLGTVRDCFVLVSADVAEDGTYVDLFFDMSAALAAMVSSGLI